MVVLYDARRSFIRPCGADEAVRLNDGKDLDVFVRTADLPAAIPFLAFRSVIGFTDNREDRINRVVVVQLAGNSVLSGRPVPCRWPPPVLSPSRMCTRRSGVTLGS